MLPKSSTVRVVASCLFVAVLIGLTGLSCPASAQETSLAEMDHKTWMARDGAPQGITALAQGPDGILWIGSEGGLFNFDGRAFNAFEPQPGDPDLPAGAVESILATPEGTLWVGFRESSIVRISHGRVTLFTQAGGRQLTGVQHLQKSSNGTLWAVVQQQTLIRFGGDGAWHVETTPLGDAGGPIHDIFVDSSDTLWLAQGGRLYRRPLDQSKYLATEAKADWPFGFAETPDRSIWIADTITGGPQGPTGRTQHIDRYGKLLAHLPDTENVTDMLYLPDGSVITAPYGEGLLRFPREVLTPTGKDARRDRYRQQYGLSSDSVKVLLLDTDGNLWAGGEKGLDRFRKARLVPFVTEDRSVDSLLCAGKNGDVWVETSGTKSSLYKVSGDLTKTFDQADQIYSISCGADGDTLLVGNDRIAEVHADRITPIPLVPGAAPFQTRQVVAAPDHTLFAAVSGGPNLVGIWRYAQGRWTKLDGSRIPAVPPYTEYVDSHGQLWTGYRGGMVGLPLEGEGRLLTSGNPGLGTVYAVLETAHELFAGGLNGLAVLRGGRFEMLAVADRASSRGVAGIVESANGDLWLNASRGIVRIPIAELQTALENPRYRMKSELLAEGDFVGPVVLKAGRPNAARDAEGNLWFASMNGVFHIEPGQQIFGAHLPIVSIKSILADGSTLGSDQTIGPRPQSLDIQYLGVNLTAPERVIYRYRLDGLDDGWQGAGHRTVAIYPHLPPGTYTFRVEASNDGTTWTQPVSSAGIVVLPDFYQTRWFLVLCGIIVLASIWFLVTLRIRAVTRDVRARAEERADERIRISRELHDTLLQGIQGLLLTFHVAAQKVPADDDSRKLLDSALTTADRIIIEGRNRVNSLRSEHLTDAELTGSLENVGNDLRIDDRIELRVIREGIDATLHAHIADEIFYIAREALTNAFRHSQASKITLRLLYGSRYFSMSCKDDGRGFDITNDEKPGHWGMTGMSERAQRIGGKLHCRSKAGHGTEILLVLPSYRAYKHHSRLTFYLRAFHLYERDPAHP